MHSAFVHARLTGWVFRAAGVAVLAVALLLAVAVPPARAGTAWTGTINGDLTLQAGDTLYGAVAVTGTLTVPSGVHVVVTSTSLSVQAAHIVIAGTLDGSGSGSAGGSPSSPAQGSGAGSSGLAACAGGGGAGGAGAGGAGGGSPAGAGGAGGPAVAEGAGSGGGAGASCGAGQGGSGGSGGAAVHLTSSDIRISGAVRVDGVSGQGFPVTPFSGPGGGGGGGGSGGDLWLSGQTVLSGTLSAVGGNGGVGGTNGGAQGGGGGGGGGGGRIHIDGGSLIGEPGYAVMTGGGVGGVGGSGGSPATGGAVGGNGVGTAATQGADPVASAGGPYSATPGRTITLDATASSDPNGLPLSYAWDFSGGSSGYADATTARPSFPVDSGAAVGTKYTVCVEVSNGFQVSQPACSTVTVVAPSAPTAAISPASQTIENTGGPTTVTLDASHSQGNGATLTYAWTSTDGAIEDTSAAVTSLTIPALQNTALSTVTATVTVSNGYSTASASTTISIVDTTPPALALPSPISVAATSDSGAAVSWTATATDAVWTAVTPVCSPRASGSTFPVGTTTVTCTATDGAENSSSGSFPVTVTQTPAAVSIGQVPDKTYGDPPFSVTATGTPGAGDITIAGSGACAVDTAVPASVGDGTKTVTVDITAAGTCALDATQASGGGHTAGTAPTVTVTVAKATAQVDWPAPADIVYGTPLGADQLDATTSWPGSWSYTADAGTADATGLVLAAGDHTLSAVFTPADPADVNGITSTVPLHVALAPQLVSFTNAPPSPATYGGAWTPTFTAGGATTTPVLGLAPSSPGCSLDAGTVRFTGVSTCSVTLDQAGDANHLPAPQTVEQFTVTPAATTLVSTTPASVALGGGLVPSARLTSTAAPCQQGQTVAFSLDRNPLTGVVGSYSLGSGTTDATGTVTAPTVSTSGWQATAYTLTATYAGTGNCSPASDAAALTVTAPGQVAAGAGAYDAAGVGTVTFGFAVTRVPFAVVPSYVGGVSIVQDGTWSYQGVITSYVKTTASSATVSGSGTLYWWNPALNHNRGGWAVAQKAVPFTASFTPTTRNGPGTFGTRLTYTPLSPQPPLLPNSAPAALIRGAIVML